jgi:hypothetical protein
MSTLYHSNFWPKSREPASVTTTADVAHVKDARYDFKITIVVKDGREFGLSGSVDAIGQAEAEKIVLYKMVTLLNETLAEFVP